MVMPKSPVGCPLDSLLRLLMGPWTTYILWVLTSNGPTRFGELKRKVPGISAKVLTERLRMLQDAERDLSRLPADDSAAGDLQPDQPRRRAARGPGSALSVIASDWKAVDAARRTGTATSMASRRPTAHDAPRRREPAPAVASPSAPRLVCRPRGRPLPAAVAPEGWPSGRRRTPGVRVYLKRVSRVRIPPPPPHS